MNAAKRKRLNEEKRLKSIKKGSKEGLLEYKRLRELGKKDQIKGLKIAALGALLSTQIMSNDEIVYEPTLGLEVVGNILQVYGGVKIAKGTYKRIQAKKRYY